LNEPSELLLQEKFDVALWFEEVDNDLRRRQYDLSDVRLRKTGETFTFPVPGIQEFHPPVLLGDAVDVFDPDDPSSMFKHLNTHLMKSEHLLFYLINTATLTFRIEVPGIY
jgi:hypothetical protein